MASSIKVAFATGTDDLNRDLIAEMRRLLPELPLYVVSDFPPEDRDLKWLPYHVNRSFAENYARCRAGLRDKDIRLAGVMLVPGVPFRRLRWIAFLLAPARFIAFNENLGHFMLRPRAMPAMLRHLIWRASNFVRALGQVRPVPLAEPVLEAMAPGVFAGRAVSGKPRILVASCYPIFPLSHGGAVRMYNLMRRAAEDFDLILVCFTDKVSEPAREVLDICVEIVQVFRPGSHSLPSTGRPEVVEEFASDGFRSALREAVRKWTPAVVQLEFTQMAQYAADCAPAKTILVEHDITFDLYEQMLAVGDDWELRRQLKLWQRFEKEAWSRVDCVVTMSEKDRRLAGARAVTLPNGVDLERFRPAAGKPDAGRLLFIGSFAHLPNLLALRFFLDEVWPLLSGVTLHVIAGSRHEYYLDYYRDRVNIQLQQAGIELDGFVADVRPAYEKATLVLAPLIASAGTNIKVLEAMAMGKAVVSTSAGINGLDLKPGRDMVLADSGAEMAAAIRTLLEDEQERARIETAARVTAETQFSWDAIAARQADLYRKMAGG